MIYSTYILQNARGGGSNFDKKGRRTFADGFLDAFRSQFFYLTSVCPQGSAKRSPNVWPSWAHTCTRSDATRRNCRRKVRPWLPCAWTWANGTRTTWSRRWDPSTDWWTTPAWPLSSLSSTWPKKDGTSEPFFHS